MDPQDFNEKRVLVMGLGLSGGGVGVVKFLAKNGARLMVMDLKTRRELAPALEELKDLVVKYIFGKNPLRVLKKTDRLIVNPAVDLRSKFVMAARKKKIPIDSELGIFLKLCPTKLVAVTGTKGKSTVSRLIYETLKSAGRHVFWGGNIGISLLDRLHEMTPDSYVVLEISSFQLDLFRQSNLAFAPHIAVLTNIFPDHLDRYNSFHDYKESKLSLFTHQTRHDYAVVPSALRRILKKTKSRPIGFQPTLPGFIPQERIKIIGDHNKENISAALAVARILKIDPAVARRTVIEFGGLEHRLEFLRYIRGVRFYNDSASTTPTSTVYAIQSFKRPVLLIAGGLNKGLPLTELARAIAKKTKGAYLVGKNANEIKRMAKRLNPTLHLDNCDSLRQAVKNAFKAADIDDTILLSPGCASFECIFRSEEHTS